MVLCLGTHLFVKVPRPDQDTAK